MTEPIFLFDPTVELIKTDFDDRWPVLAARTSTLGAESTAEERRGLINALIRDRHGVPFEHMTMTVRVKAPIFAWRQIVKHRAGVSLSEESGRYRELAPEFYWPGYRRPLIQVGKPMAYQFDMGDYDDVGRVGDNLMHVAQTAWNAYRDMLDNGIAREVARMVLPLSTMSTGVLTFNARSLMAFLSLRTSAAGSHPQYEVQQVADLLAVLFAEHAPMTYAAFTNNGSVAP